MTTTHETLIATALEYYDSYNEKYRGLFKKVKNTKIELTPYDMERNKIKLLDKDNEELLTSKYEVVGVYSNEYKMWSWAWSVPKFKKNNTYISRKILYYGLDLDPESSLKSELITSRFLISNPIQIELHLAIASYLAKKIIYKYVYYPDEKNQPDNFIVNYIFLLDVDTETDKINET